MHQVQGFLGRELRCSASRSNGCMLPMIRAKEFLTEAVAAETLLEEWGGSRSPVAIDWTLEKQDAVPLLSAGQGDLSTGHEF